ncbi:MAG: hypothetical protein ACOY82_17745 [Pseudomonadota bacterium]
MPRPSTSLNVVLLVVVLVQAWMLHRRDEAIGAANAAEAVATEVSPRTASIPGATDHDPLALAVMDRLQRIDARLAALEAGARPAQAAQREAPALPERIDPRTFADADRRLAALLPDREIDQQDWVRWQTALSALSAEERFALSAALSRALNENRLRLRF